jgi:hypothetical protein
MDMDNGATLVNLRSLLFRLLAAFDGVTYLRQVLPWPGQHPKQSCFELRSRTACPKFSCWTIVTISGRHFHRYIAMGEYIKRVEPEPRQET